MTTEDGNGEPGTCQCNKLPPKSPFCTWCGKAIFSEDSITELIAHLRGVATVRYRAVERYEKAHSVNGEEYFLSLAMKAKRSGDEDTRWADAVAALVEKSRGQGAVEK